MDWLNKGAKVGYMSSENVWLNGSLIIRTNFMTIYVRGECTTTKIF